MDIDQSILAFLHSFEFVRLKLYSSRLVKLFTVWKYNKLHCIRR